MADLTPREPHRPLIWPDMVDTLQELLQNSPQPVYIVGGAVRDALLHRPLYDLDLTVAEGGIALARRIANSLKGDFFVLDDARDVGRAIVAGNDQRLVVDVARFRGDTLLADLSDRDFTLNAMAVDLTADTHLLIDPLGGERDIQTKQMRRCSPHSLMDDPIRSLRAVRQSVQLGFRIESETLQDVRAVKDRLLTVSAERSRDELIKLLALPKARMALRVAETLGLLDDLLPEILRLKALAPRNSTFTDSWQQTLSMVEKMGQIITAIGPGRSDYTGATFGMGMFIIQMDRYRRRLLEHIERPWPNDRPHIALLVLGILLRAADSDTILQRAQALRLSNAERDRLVGMIRYGQLILEVDDQSVLAIHRFWRKAGEAGVDACLWAAAYYLGTSAGEIDQDDWLAVVERLRLFLDAYYDHYHEIVEPPVLVDGNQLMAALELKRGPVIGLLLDRIREAQVMGLVHTTEDAFQLARTTLGETNHN